MARGGFSEKGIVGKPLQDFDYSNVMIWFMSWEARSLAFVWKMHCSGGRGTRLEASSPAKDDGSLVLWHSSGDRDKMTYSWDILKALLICWIQTVLAWAREDTMARW